MATLKKKPISLLIRYAGDRLKAFGIGKKNLEQYYVDKCAFSVYNNDTRGV